MDHFIQADKLSDEERALIENLPSIRDGWNISSLPSRILQVSCVVLGASGDLAKKKTFPALFALFSKGFLPHRLQIIGLARSKLTDESLRDQIKPFLVKAVETTAQAAAAKVITPKEINTDCACDEDTSTRMKECFENSKRRGIAQVEDFLKLCSYWEGEYSDESDSGKSCYKKLTEHLAEWESRDLVPGVAPYVGRLYYLALPPVLYPKVCRALHRHASEVCPGATLTSWIRIICEKPFGRDLCSSEALASDIGALWAEESLYRIDHYLGKELVQNMLVIRFANGLFSSWWNRHWISNVQITFKEDYGTQGRGGYFDQYGIIRDVIQNHLLQVMALLAMEPPVSLHPDDVRDEKVKLLRCVTPIKPEDCVLGQYTAAGDQPGYLDDPTVPSDSVTPTFATVKMSINNDRWAGVPFIIKAGKALNERCAVARVQLKAPAAPLFGEMEHLRNELVIRFQPGEAIYAKLVVKKPGLDMKYEMSELDLTYPERYRAVDIPDAYERLILDCIRGDQQHFVRRDELRASWAIVTPLLQAIDNKNVPRPHLYPYGSRGPPASDDLIINSGYVKTDYDWLSTRVSVDGQGSTSRKSTSEAAASK